MQKWWKFYLKAAVVAMPANTIVPLEDYLILQTTDDDDDDDDDDVDDSDDDDNDDDFGSIDRLGENKGCFFMFPSKKCQIT